MAVPRLTKLIDLMRGVLPERGESVVSPMHRMPDEPSGVPVAPDSIGATGQDSVLYRNDTPLDELFGSDADAPRVTDGLSDSSLDALPRSERPASSAPDGRIGNTDQTVSETLVDTTDLFEFGTPARPGDIAAQTDPIETRSPVDIPGFDTAVYVDTATTFSGLGDDPVTPENGQSLAGHPEGCDCGDCCGSDGHHGHNHPEQPTAYASDGGEEPTPTEATPTSGHATTSVTWTGTNAIDSLLLPQKWDSGGGTLNLTYSFGTSSSVYISGYSEPNNGFGEFSDHQKAATRSALDYWSDVADITFTEVTDSATVAGDLRFAKSSDPSTAWAYIPVNHTKGGDVWVGPSTSYNNMSEGTYGFATMLHEIGHALGLAHTHDGTAAASNIDWTGYSVMSYRSYENAPLTGYTQSYYPTTPMLNDIKAIQYLYGANNTHNTGDTTYSWTTGGRVYEAIWDAGGTDTIDWSNQSSAAEINLNTGVWSKLGPTYYSKYPTTEDRTMMIAEGTVIENANGGSGNDTITGNSAANILTGNGGNDALTGGAGDDRFVFSSGFGSDTISDFTAGDGSVDTLDFSSYGYTTYSQVLSNISFADVSGNAVLTLGSDTVTLTGVTVAELDVDDFFGVVAGATEGDDTLAGTSGNNVIDGLGGNDSISGNGGNDFLRGGAGTDNIAGNTGDDTLYGDAGDDTLNGGTGDDGLHGGAGRDTFVFSADFGNDTIYDFQIGFDKINLDALNVADFTTLLSNTADVSGNAVITLGSNTLTIDGITKAQLQQGDFIGVNPVGTSGNDTIFGFDTDDTISGLAGNDVINGGGGADTLNGNDGDDRLIGGTGADTMAGGAGNDTYLVDNASDTVTENSSEGTDTVEAEVTYTIGSNVENLTLVGNSAINGSGNSAANVLRGNDAANTLTGNGGADAIFGFGGDDTLNGGSSFDSLIGGDGADTVNAGDGADWIRGEAGNDILNGEGGNDKIYGEAGNDTLDGGTGSDIMTGGIGDDIYVYDSAGDRAIENADEGTDTIQSTANYTVLADNVENLTLTGSGNISGTGNSLNNTITGNSGDNTLIGGGGNDTLIGGEGSDRYIISDNTDTITEGSAAAGTDTVVSSITYSISTNIGIEDIELSLSSNIDATGNANNNTLTGNSGSNTLDGDSGNDTLYGMAGNDTLVGGDGNDTLDGGTGTDSLTGGTGDDTYVLVDALDSITENASEGTDTVQAYFNYTLGSNLENLTLAGASHINGTGNSLDNTITGNSARNTIDGGTGADTMAGGAGDDTYYVDNASDTVTESGGGGTDRVFSSVTFTIGANVENLTLTGGSAIDAYGNTGNNVLTGNSAANYMNGNSGDDTIFGFGGNDTINGGDGTDTLYGDAGSDTINGGGGNDAIRGGAGRDTFAFSSGFGDDTIYDFTVGFDSIDLTGLGVGTYSDLLSNTADSGSDAVITLSGNTITLSNVLKASLQEGDFVGLTPGATSGNDTMNGLETADNLDGGDGNDTIYGNGGGDTLAGGAGNDYIDGGAGADTMSGGTGDDTFVVNHNSDTVTENASEGTDTVQSDTGWTLGANIENLTLTGVLNINGNGNSLNNIIHGNDANNVLTGNGGNDALFGNGGDDTLNGGSTWDSLIGGSGNDTVNGGGGNDWIRGEDGNDTLNGEGDRDRMFGEAGNDRLVGGDGQDTMTGGAGDDIFEYNALSELGDTITDFEVGANGDALDLITLLTAVGYSGSDALGDGRVRAVQNGADTNVEIDTTGAGSYARVATLENITATDLTTDNWIFS